MIRYWFKFKLNIKDNPPPGTLLGCGVTAISKDEALDILKQRIFKDRDFPEIEDFKENVDIRRLEENHVRSNMGNPSAPGIWFPLGYS